MSDQNDTKLNWQDEEEKLMHRLEQRMKTLHSEETSSKQRRERERDSGSDMDADALDSDLILGKLFFSSKLSALSPGIQFDSSIRYLDPRPHTVITRTVYILTSLHTPPNANTNTPFFCFLFQSD
jgi:hypothetical protein